MTTPDATFLKPVAELPLRYSGSRWSSCEAANRDAYPEVGSPREVAVFIFDGDFGRFVYNSRYQITLIIGSLRGLPGYRRFEDVYSPLEDVRFVLDQSDSDTRDTKDLNWRGPQMTRDELVIWFDSRGDQ